MTQSPFYREHWLEIEPERYDRYQSMFQWHPSSAVLYEPADIQPGHAVADFGCGPGYTAIEIAKWVGPGGHVHALDINKTFVADTRENARKAGINERVTAYESDGTTLPLPDGCLDRLTTRNTLIYVDDPYETLGEFKRVLTKDGKVHAIEGHWSMMVVEPIGTDKWDTVVAAASYACRTPDIGRKLTGLFAQSGFLDIEIQVITRPDREGRLLPMVRNIAEYARQGGQIDSSAINASLAELEQALTEETYLVLAPQFVVTGRRYQRPFPY